MSAPSRRGDLATVLAIVAVVAATVALPYLLPAAERGPPSSQSFGDRNPTCTEWSDGCVVCQRTDAGASCSTPGIACTRGSVQCLRRDGV